MADADLLATLRGPMLLISVGAVVVIYVLGRCLGGIPAGLASAGLVLASPIARDDLGQAVPEPLLVLCMGLCCLLAVVGMRRGANGSLPLGWAVATGLVAELGLAAKLTTVLSLAALAASGALSRRPDQQAAARRVSAGTGAT